MAGMQKLLDSKLTVKQNEQWNFTDICDEDALDDGAFGKYMVPGVSRPVPWPNSMGLVNIQPQTSSPGVSHSPNSTRSSESRRELRLVRGLPLRKGRSSG